METGNLEQSQIQHATEEWRSLLGVDGVVTQDSLLAEHDRNAYGSAVRSVAILRPTDEHQVQQIVRIASKHRTPLYPISTGRNWGYGASTPVKPGCTIVDLSALNKIRVIDADLGIVSLQPGVTQGQLDDFLRSQGLDLLVPVHGGGPTCSLLGNALERGYGLTPVTDHFDALTSVRAVLADGSIYESPFHAMGAETIGASHRWGIGPYVEGLFSQGNFGIVTEGTFTLQRRPEHVEAFMLRIADIEKMGELVEQLRTILESMGGIVTGVNLMNARRMLSMTRAYPIDQVPDGEIITDELCAAMAAEGSLTAWMAAGVIHCPYRMRRSVRRELKRLLPRSVGQPIHLNRWRVGWARRLMKWSPFGRQFVLQQMALIESLLDLSDGIPRRVALPLAYWLRGQRPATEKDLDPAQDGCGLIWYSPLVPMKSKDVHAYVDMVERVCKAHKIEPLITLTSLSERLFDSTVPILFSPEQHGAVDRAQACYDALFDEGRKIGCLPYRVGTKTMDRIVQSDDSHWSLVKKLKQAVDPHDIVAPGRYCPSHK